MKTYCVTDCLDNGYTIEAKRTVLDEGTLRFYRDDELVAAFPNFAGFLLENDEEE